MLLESPGQLVSREELRARLWPAGTLLEYDQRLNAAVNRLREALLDSAEAPRYIETLPKRGYRFIAPVEPVALRALSDLPGESSGFSAAVSPEANIAGSPGSVSSQPRPVEIADKPPLGGGRRSRRTFWFITAAGLSALVLVAVTIAVMTGR